MPLCLRRERRARRCEQAAAEGTEQQEERQRHFEHESAIAKEVEMVREAVRRDAAAARELARLDAEAEAVRHRFLPLWLSHKRVHHIMVSRAYLPHMMVLH